jgi:hypothetical protein
MARPKRDATDEVKPPSDDVRRALRNALKEQKEAHAAVARQKNAVTRMLSQTVEAEEKIPALEKSLKAASQAHIEAVAAAAVSGAEAPASTVAEAQARLAFARDNIETLRAARRQVEAEIGDYEQAAVDADVGVEALISAIIADYIELLIKEASELARRLQPYRAALLAFTADYQDRPTQWDKQRSFNKARQPLDEAANQTYALFKSLREFDAPSPCWKEARARLRANPDAAVLRHLLSEFDGLLDKSADKTPDDADLKIN